MPNRLKLLRSLPAFAGALALGMPAAGAALSQLEVEVPETSPFSQTLEWPVPDGAAEIPDGRVRFGLEGDVFAYGQVSKPAVEGDRPVLRLILPAGLEAGTHRLRLLGDDQAGVVELSANDENGVIAFRHGGGEPPAALFQQSPLADAKGGARFAGSAFIHGLHTPGGVETTEIQPSDHLHHFGLWWPWKHLEIDGKNHNCWEIQQGEGRLRCLKTTRWNGPVAAGLVADNIFEIGARGSAEPVVAQRADLAVWQWPAPNASERVLDLRLRDHRLIDRPVTASPYRYSGFSLRGAANWTAATSTVLTSEGRDRDTGHGTTARWVLVNGQSPGGAPVAVLMLSRSQVLHGKAEHLRLWNSNTHGGRIFINFNPVAEEGIAIARGLENAFERHYRLVLADRHLTGDEAELVWRSWANPPRVVE